MAKVSDLARLFYAVSAGDWGRARIVAEAIADAEAKAGRHGAAVTLRGALAATGPKSDTAYVSDSSNTTSLLAVQPDVLTLLPPVSKLADVELPLAVRGLLEEILKEHRHRRFLSTHGLQPRSRLFFHGPPGCGKTITARALGFELGLPVYVVRFDALVGSYLGQTSLRIREIFRFAEAHACVLLIDEIDAVGRRRGKSTDVGELDRIVISLMQQLDLAKPNGMIISASNIPEQLDAALLRRFDLTLEFPRPTKAKLKDFAHREASKRGIKLNNDLRHELTDAKTFADIEQIITIEHRRTLLRKV